MVLLDCGNWIGEPTTVMFKRKLVGERYAGWSGDERYNISDIRCG